MPEFEFGDRTAANQFPEDHADHLCPDDDRRMRTVTLVSDAPERVLDEAAVVSATSREDYRGVGQEPLTDAEKDRIDFSQGRASVPHAQAVKAIAIDRGVDDWTAFYDPELTTDEHRDVMERASRDERGDRLDAGKSTDERLADLEGALGEQCDHARGHCENGDPDACEYLKEGCGLDDEDVEILLSAGEDTPDDIEGAAAGALGRAWSGYKGGIERLADALATAGHEWENAQEAADAINGIRRSHGQDPLHFERLESLQAELLDLTREAAADCHECHADHSGHAHDVGGDDREDVREFADRAEGAETAVIEHDEQRDLSGGRADDQARLAGMDRGEYDPETEAVVEQNEGGLLADEREDDGRPDPEDTEQAIPDEFQVAEGGQNTL